jgi:hypothetical protein
MRYIISALSGIVSRVDGDCIITWERNDDPPQGPVMVQIARIMLDEEGRPALALLVRSDNDRPSVDWPALGHPPSFDDVRVVHAALRRAYDACAPGEVGEGEGQFTNNVESWYLSILEYLANRQIANVI